MRYINALPLPLDQFYSCIQIDSGPQCRYRIGIMRCMRYRYGGGGGGLMRCKCMYDLKFIIVDYLK